VIFGGVLDRYPRLKVCLAHSGGFAPWIRGRWGQRGTAGVTLAWAMKPFDDYFALLYFDTTIHDERMLRYLVEAVGAEHVMHGTDYPADMGNWSHVPMIDELPGLSAAEKDGILGGNALRLIGRTSAR
jgi:aminocarboxymuconate-semialdehyde decarboxylase